MARSVEPAIAPCVLALVVPWLSPYRHDAIDLSSIKDAPRATHWMGTDELGRDVATRVLTGTRLSLVIGLFGALVATSIGAGLGSLAGYYGGLVDAMLMRLVDLQLSVPLLPILIVASALMRPSVALLVLMVAAFAWMEPARITRGELLRLKEQDFTEAARAIGASDARVIMKHLLPNALGPFERRRYDSRRPCDRDGVRVELYRSRGATARAEPGELALWCAGIAGHRALARNLPRDFYFLDRARGELARRRATAVSLSCFWT